MRKLTSLLLTLSGVFLLITSVVMYILPTGRVAYWADYHLLWLTKTQWGDLHISFGCLVITCSFFHFLFNFKILMNYLRNRARRVSFFNPNFITAFILSAYVAVGTIFSLPPMNFILEYSEQFKQSAEMEYGVPPYGHAELSSLKSFCKKMDFDSEKALVALRNGGIVVADENEILKNIASANKQTPQNLYRLIATDQPCSESKKNKQHSKQENQQPRLQQEANVVAENLGDKNIENVENIGMVETSPKPIGLGQMTLTALCAQYGLSVDESVSILQENGIIAEPMQTVKEIARENNSMPMVILETLVKE